MKKVKPRGKEAKIATRSATCAVVVFFALFVMMMLVGTLCFPTDEANTLQAPDWFPFAVITVSFAGAVISKKVVASSLKKRLLNVINVPLAHVPVVDYVCPEPEPVHTCATLNEKEPEGTKGQDELEIIRAIEERFENMYKFAYDHMLNAEDCRRAYNAVMKNYDYSKLPLAAQVRLEQLSDEYKAKFENPNPMLYVDSMKGPEFEQWCARLLLRSGFNGAKVTPGSGDQGVDIVAVKDGVWYAIQCKRYASDLGNAPVQEVFAGKVMYGCQVAAVMTNAHFTAGAKELAAKTQVLLWDREKLLEMIKNYGRV